MRAKVRNWQRKSDLGTISCSPAIERQRASECDVVASMCLLPSGAGQRNPKALSRPNRRWPVRPPTSDIRSTTAVPNKGPVSMSSI